MKNKDYLIAIVGFAAFLFVLIQWWKSDSNQLPNVGTTESAENNLVKNIAKEYGHYWMHIDPENGSRIILEFHQDYFKMELFSYSEYSNEFRSFSKMDGAWNKIGDFEVEGRIGSGEMEGTVINWYFAEDYKSMKNSKIEFVRLSKEINSTDNNASVDYPEIKILQHTWMAKNLDVSSFRNGDPIQEAKSEEEWKSLGDSGLPAWCHYENDPKNDEIHGKLYNWYAVKDKRGLAPNGWNIPSYADWRVLINNLGGEEEVGIKLKSKTGWNNNGNGNNDSGLNFKPSGVRSENGDFIVIDAITMLWSYNEYDKDKGQNRALTYENNTFEEGSMLKQYGMSVRCMKYSK